MIEMKKKYPNSMAYKYSLEEISSPVFKSRLEKAVAEKALALNIKNVVFDRGGYLYHGRVQALADAAREAGLKF